MQTISKYFAAFLLTVLSSVFGDGQTEETEKETVIRESIKKSYPCTEAVKYDSQEFLLI